MSDIFWTFVVLFQWAVGFYVGYKVRGVKERRQ